MEKIITDVNLIREKSIEVASVEEATSIIEKLEKVIDASKNGIGLSAIQIGIPKSVSLIKNESKRIALINPKIISCEGEFVYYKEGCLSFPDQYINTKRYHHCTIENDVIDNNSFRKEILYFYYPEIFEEMKYDDIICIAVQHEIDHINGKVMFDNEVISEPILSKPKIGRNDPCSCGSGKKYKKCCG